VGEEAARRTATVGESMVAVGAPGDGYGRRRRWERTRAAAAVENMVDGGRSWRIEEMKFGLSGVYLKLVTPVGLVQRPTWIINSRRLGQVADGNCFISIGLVKWLTGIALFLLAMEWPTEIVLLT
jgi:hypothetical protein